MYDKVLENKRGIIKISKHKQLMATGLAVAVLLLFLTSCSKKAPECNDKQTKSMVVEIATNKLSKVVGAGNMEGITFDVTSVRTPSFDKNIGKYECAADINVTAPEGNQVSPITYSSELLEDKKGSFNVNVFGLDKAIAFIKPPIPNTRKAYLAVLQTGMELLKEIGGQPGNLTPDEKGKFFAEHTKKAYEKAGYNLDRSIWQLAAEFDKNPNYINEKMKQYFLFGFEERDEATGGVRTWMFVSAVHRPEEESKMKLKQFFSKKTNDAMDKIINKVGSMQYPEFAK